MSIESNSTRAFNREISQSLNQHVKVTLEYNDRYYRGKLVGVEMNSLSLCLENAVDEKNNKYPKLFIRGNSWATISAEGEPFPMEKLLDRIKKVLPGEEITVTDDNKIHLLGGKLVVTETGVEGRGPTKDRVQKVFEAFVSEIKK